MLLYIEPPSHIVIYDFLYEKVRDKQLYNYTIVETTFHALYTETSGGYFQNVHLLILS